MKVIIDCGHGISTPGKRSPKGMLASDPEVTVFYEYSFNRDILCRMEPLMKEAGIEYFVLVPEIRDISLSVRARRANQFHLDNPDCFLLSIHANAGGGTGYEVFTSPGVTKADKLAEIVFEHAKKALEPLGFRMRTDKSDGDHDKEAKFYMLTKTSMPAILTENLFYDNEKDLAFLISDEGRQTIAQYHVDALKEIML